MKLFLLILLGLIIWFISAILSSLIARKLFLLPGDEKFWAIVCTLLAPATFIVMLAILPFHFYTGLFVIFWKDKNDKRRT